MGVNFASCDLNGFSSVDDDILTTETLTVEDTVTEVKNQQNSASDEKNLQEEEDSEEQEIEVNVPTINKALQAIRVVHNFYEATSENVQLICNIELNVTYKCSISLQGSRHKLQISSIPVSKCEYYTYFICFVLCVCVPMPTHCTITCFGFHARWIDGIECGLFSNHAPLGQTTLRVG